MTTCVKFPSINQFRNAIRNIRLKASYDGLDEEGNAKHKTVVYPTLTFFGTTKSHGTNAAIRQDVAGNELIYQSRERIITPMDDNAGFATYMYSLEKEFTREYMDYVRQEFWILDDEPVVVYGEWCAGNIQSGVAINGLPKMFLVFAVRFGFEENTRWFRPDHNRFDVITDARKYNVYPISQFGTYRVEVDINNPEHAQNEIVKLVEQVEKECPIGAYFGNKGIGEGIVFYALDLEYRDGSVFKAKGEKHSSSKVKTVAAIDIEHVESLKALVDTIVTENRLNQMVGVLKDREGLDVDIKNTNQFMKITLSDCVKEELDTIIGNGFNTTEFSKQASIKIRSFWLKLINSMV